MFTDELRRSVWDQIRQRDLQQFARLLPQTLVMRAAQQAGVNFGRGILNLSCLLWLALGCAMHTTHNFAGVLLLSLKLLRDVQDWSPQPAAVPRRERESGRGKRRSSQRRRRKSKHDPHGQHATALSEEAFVQARQRLPQSFWIALILLLGEAFEQQHPDLHRYRGFRLLALDGTCIALSRWRRLAEHFGTGGNSSKDRRCCPQARMVMLQFPFTRLPWRYQLSPLAQGERTVAAGLLQQLQSNDLVLMDRGFFSYGLFWQISRRQAYFAIRLMAGVKLQTIRRLGYKDRLVRWRPSDRQWKRAGLPPAIELRVIDYQVRGFRGGAIVTNVLSPNRVSRRQWIGLGRRPEVARRIAPRLYHRRWEIETTFRELKIHQRMQGQSLRGRTPEAIAYEIAGHVVLYLLVRWLMVEAAKQQGLNDVLRLSFVNALREISDLSAALLLATRGRVQLILLPLLLARITEHVVPDRPGRHYPRPGDSKSKNKGRGKYALPAKLSA